VEAGDLYVRRAPAAAGLRASAPGGNSAGIFELHELRLDGALVSGIVMSGSRPRVYRGALAHQVVDVGIDSKAA